MTGPRIASLKRLAPASSVEDRKDFASCFNATLDHLGVAAGEEFLIAHESALEQHVPRAGHCRYCNDPVDAASGYRLVTGWERITRPPSSTKAFHAPERGGEYACASCVAKLKAGTAPAQQALA